MLSLLFPPRRRAAANSDIGGAEPACFPIPFGRGGGVRTKAGVTVSEDSSLTYSGVWCATRVLVEAAGMCPCFIYERLASNDRRAAPEHPVFTLVKDAPNPEMPAIGYWEFQRFGEIIWGNSYAEIERRDYFDPESDPVALWPIHPCRVSVLADWETDRQGNNLVAAGYYYKIRNDDNTCVVLRRDEMLHTPGVLTEDGITGKGVIQYARESIGYAKAVENHGSAYFGSGAQPPGMVAGADLRKPEERKNFRAEWKELHAAGSSEIVLLPNGATYTPFAISNEDSQFLGSQEWGIETIGRWFKVNPYLLMSAKSIGVKASVEQAGIEFVTFSLMPWLIRSAQQINFKLIRPADLRRYYAEHVVEALQRGDLKGRVDALRLMIGTGLMSINEARRLENQNSIGAAGDQYYLPANLVTADRIMAGTAPAGPGPGSDQSGAADDGLPGGPIDDNAEPQPDAVVTVKPAIEGASLAAVDLADKPDATALALVALTDKLTQIIVSFSQPRAEERPAQPPAAANASSGRAVARMILADAVKRWRTKEANAAKREAKRSDFPEWLATFHSEQRENAVENFAPSAAALTASGNRIDAPTLAADMLRDSHTELSAAFETDTAPQFSARLESWATHADEIAQRIAGTEPTPAASEPEPTPPQPDAHQQTLALLTEMVKAKSKRTRWVYNPDGTVAEKIEE